MLKVVAMTPKSSSFLEPKNYRNSSNAQPRSRPVWKTVLKVAVIIVAIAAAIYVGKTYVIPAIAKFVTAVKAGAAAVGEAVVETATTAATTAKFVPKAVWFATGQPLAVGGGTSAGWAGANFINTAILKPIEAIKIVFKAVGELVETETVSVPFAAAGGGGVAW